MWAFHPSYTYIFEQHLKMTCPWLSWFGIYHDAPLLLHTHYLHTCCSSLLVSSICYSSWTSIFIPDSLFMATSCTLQHTRSLHKCQCRSSYWHLSATWHFGPPWPPLKHPTLFVFEIFLNTNINVQSLVELLRKNTMKRFFSSWVSDFLYVIPRSFVPDKYLSICSAAVWCARLGFAINALSLFTANAMSGHVAIARYWRDPIRRA